MVIAVLGHGVVGSGVVKILDENKDEGIEIKKILVSKPSSLKDDRFTLDFNEILQDEQIDTIVECMGGDEIPYAYVLRALGKKKNVISANKKMLARHLDLFEVARDNGVVLLNEASCGGGIPCFANLRRLKRNDTIFAFKGILNGTSNYLLTRLFQEDKSFNEILQDAKALGYAEADPKEDLNGDDARYKACLCIKEAFDLCTDYEKILCLGIEKMNNKDIAYAKRKGMTIKLVARGEYKDGKLEASVLPVLMNADALLARVSSNFNYLQIDCKYLGEAGFYGQGAGSLPTGQAILMDLYDLKDKKFVDNKKNLGKKAVDDERRGIFYIRNKNLSLHEELIKERVDEDCFISKELKICELKELLNKYKEEESFVMEVEE